MHILLCFRLSASAVPDTVSTDECGHGFFDEAFLYTFHDHAREKINESSDAVLSPSGRCGPGVFS